ncbi:hypothetical protein LX97_02512 [Nonlabens dokdonensis]|uniref:Uncharacterized protein n=2 Tax=Nonlabens dokdonensis TaxID=328515 RepID=L7WEM2_NONDD|nr:hypothetical protein [Nonlabens dokdonensis]AGC78727.1 hypothetical protein DDD_3600 [Nonlabens dokdonensis DSW-6]PZX39146.1 hypothetical protein LX97_02512 [Nonlabens dokdonensis]
MIFDVLKQRWLRKEFEVLENSSRSKMPQWPQSLVILFDSEKVTDLTIFHNWCKELRIPVDNLTLIGSCKDVQKANKENVVLFDKKLLKWSGGIANAGVENALSKSYDLQINYYETDSELMRYLAMKLKSNFKVGYGHQNDSTYDLAVNVPLTSHALFISEIAKYLNILTQ